MKLPIKKSIQTTFVYIILKFYIDNFKSLTLKGGKYKCAF
jgi:hypothetical protein